MVAADSIEVAIDPRGLDSHAGRRDSNERPLVRRSVSVRIKLCGFAMRLLVTGQQPAAGYPSVTHLSRAHDWLAQLTTGKAKPRGDRAAGESQPVPHHPHAVPGCLAPDILRAILDGTHPPEFTSGTLKRNLPLPIDWQQQRKLFGFPSI